MIGSIRKQDEEIEKVFIYTSENAQILAENAMIRRHTKSRMASLERTVLLIEDFLFKEANSFRGERLYKLFSKMHITAMQVVHEMENNGNLSRRVEQLTDQVGFTRPL